MATDKKTATIPLGVVNGPDAAGAVEAIMRRELQGYLADGWEPEVAIDLESLRRAGTLVEAGSLFGSGPTEIVAAVVPLKRTVP